MAKRRSGLLDRRLSRLNPERNPVGRRLAMGSFGQWQAQPAWGRAFLPSRQDRSHGCRRRHRRRGGRLNTWNVYALINCAGVTYTGVAIDIDARLVQHNSGAGAMFTRGRGPWRIVHVEGPLSHGDALRREAAIKEDRRFKIELRSRTNGGS